MIDDSYDKTNFPHALLPTDRQVPRLCKAFANNSSANVNLSKTQLSKTVRKIFNYTSCTSTGLPLVKNILEQLAKSVLTLLELTAAVAVVVYAGIHKNLLNHRSEC